MVKKAGSRNAESTEIIELRQRLAELEQTVNAIRSGEVDALVVSGENGDQVYTLKTAERPYRVMIEQMSEGALTISTEGTILYCNESFARMIKRPAEEIVATRVDRYIDKENWEQFHRLLKQGGRAELTLVAKDQTRVPVYLAVNTIQEGAASYCSLVVTDLTEHYHAEQIVASERYARTLLEQAADAILVCDISGIIIRASEKAFSLLSHDLLGHHIDWIFRRFYAVTGKEKSCSSQGNQIKFDAIRNLSIFSGCEISEIADDKSGRSFLLNYSRIVEGFTVLGYSISLSDITEQKRVEKTLKETRDYLDNLLNYANAPIIVWGPDFRITQFNHAFERLTGHLASEVLGQIIDILFPEGQREYSMHNIQRTVAGERWETVEIPVIRTDGTVRIVLWNSANIYQPDSGQIIATIAQGQDITERKKAEEQIQEQLRILEQAQVLVRDMQGTITFWNQGAERMYGYSKEEAIGRKAYDLLLTIFPEPLPEIEHELVQTGKWEGELEHTRKDGKKVNVSGHWTLYRKDSSTPPLIIEANTDITERKQAEETLKRYTQELESANKELESFSYSVSHDLRSPLRALDGFSQLVSNDYADKLDDTGKDYLNRIRKASQYMAELIDDILKLSRINRADMFRDKVDLAVVARAILADLKASQPDRQVEVLTPSSIVVYGDQQLLTIALRNLLENAWKFTGKCSQSRIEFGVKPQGVDKVYFIKDNGAGFNMKYADKLFQPFQRLHSEKDYEGTGIGLAIVQRVIRRHGGRVWGESEKGQGATFYFTLG